MAGPNLREEFRRKRLKCTAIDYHIEYYADGLTRQDIAGGSDRVSQSLASIHLDQTLNHTEAAMFAYRNPLQQGGVLADEVRLGKTIEAALVQCRYWTDRSTQRSSIKSLVRVADVRHELGFDDRMENLWK